jgi:hypothetical protein
MPEFVMPINSSAGKRQYNGLDEFTRGFIRAMFWADTGAIEDGSLQDACFENLAPEALDQIVRECQAFQRENATDLAGAKTLSVSCTFDDAGFNFYCNRNDYGTGFWDSSWPPPFGNRLSRQSNVYCGLRPYIGGNGLIYVENA